MRKRNKKWKNESNAKSDLLEEIQEPVEDAVNLALMQAYQEGRTATVEAINEMLSPLKWHLCWITEDGNPDPISYGLADEDGDEIDFVGLIDSTKERNEG